MSYLQDQLKLAVGNVLMSSQTGKIKMFTVSGQTLVASFYQALAARMSMFDSMKVEYDSTLKKGTAEYDSDTNTMKIGFTAIEYDEHRGIIIHESTHAVCDMVKMTITVADSEVMAYIAQCQYMLANFGNYPLTGKTAAKTAIFAAAWKVAEKIQNGQIPSETDYSTVRLAVCSDSDYGEKSSSKAAAFDGLQTKSGWWGLFG